MQPASQRPKDATPDRPPIWVDGRQQPRFLPREWLRVGHAMTRLWLVPRMARSAEGLQHLGQTIATGRYAPDLRWLGQAGRFVPSKTRVGLAVTGLGLRLAEAGLLLAPAADAPLAYPDLGRSPPKARPQPDAEPTLQAIRDVMRHLPPESDTAEADAKTPAPQKADRPNLPAHALAYALLGLAMPLGLAQALYFHLNGGDLADWE